MTKKKVELTERQIDIMELRDVDQLPWREIAEKYGCTIGSVNGSYLTANKKLEKAELDGHDPDEILDGMTESFASL